MKGGASGFDSLREWVLVGDDRRDVGVEGVERLLLVVLSFDCVRRGPWFVPLTLPFEPFVSLCGDPVVLPFSCCVPFILGQPLPCLLLVSLDSVADNERCRLIVWSHYFPRLSLRPCIACCQDYEGQWPGIHGLRLCHQNGSIAADQISLTFPKAGVQWRAVVRRRHNQVQCCLNLLRTLVSTSNN